MTEQSSSDQAKTWLQGAQRVVIKMGSSLLINPVNGQLRTRWLDGIVRDVVDLNEQGAEVVLVASGAVALGRAALNLARGELRLEESQAAAAAGQVRLAHGFQTAFAAAGKPVAQVLLTFHDTEDRRRHLNARRTLQTLLGVGAIAVVNENDTVATDELRYGDNDRLAARVAQMIDARLLVLLSDVDGLYDANPALAPAANHVASVAVITRQIAAMAGDTTSSVGTGGMRTKIQAARIATAAGCRVILGDGRATQPVGAILNGARCTLFTPQGMPGSARKRWIAGTLERRGELHVDAGAARALSAGKSLLSAGVARVEGDFERGDAVSIVDDAGSNIAVGLCAYDVDEARRLTGVRSEDIERHLGYRGRAAMVHRDDLVMMGSENV